MADYKGKIANTGAQVVEAPNPQPKVKKGKVKKGKDLRVKG